MTKGYWTEEELLRARTRCRMAIDEAEACGAAEEIVEGMRAGLWANEKMIASMEDCRQ